MSEFKVSAMEKLTDQQVRFAPPGVRQQQLERARALRDQVVPDRPYPYQFVSYRITDYRGDGYPGLNIPGDDLRHDLDLFLDRVARSLQTAGLELPTEPPLSLGQVGGKFHVSTKNNAPPRKRGLIGPDAGPHGLPPLPLVDRQGGE